MLKEKNYPIVNFENIKVWNEILDSFDIEKINITTLMYQTGYLTIKEKRKILWERIEYKLWIPNEEIRQSLNNYLIRDYFLFEDLNKNYEKISALDKALSTWDIEFFIEIIKSIFAWIPYSNYTKNNISKYEWFYSSVIYSFLAWSWVDFIAEDFTNKGRIDFTLQYNNKFYIIELKVEKTWLDALKQIKTKKYEEKYLNPPTPLIKGEVEIFLIWLNFDEEKKNLWDSTWEKM